MQGASLSGSLLTSEDSRPDTSRLLDDADDGADPETPTETEQMTSLHSDSCAM